ncbi:MAG: flagellar biosynthesis protein FliQ [Sphingobacteriia bacterium]|nr:flagellar biosynthesis protein FliQ [Sphingobacteriia bacterium]
MEGQEIVAIAGDAIFVFLKISAPALLIALTVGLVISLIQALTQIQETTISFVPKMIAILLCLLLAFPFMGNQLKTFSERINEKIIALP